MTTFVSISYTYVSTAPRSKSAIARCKPVSKQSSILDKLQRIKPSSVALSTTRLAAVAGVDDIKETGTVNDSDDDENDYDDCELLSIEQLLYTTLQKEGFAAEDQRPNNTVFGVGDATAEKSGGSYDDNNESVPDDNSGSSLEDPIVLLGDDDSSVSEAEVDDGGPCAESIAADGGLLDSPETVVDPTTPASPSPDVWHDIDDFLETTERLRRSEQKPSTPNSVRLHASPSRVSSEPLHDHTSTAGQCTVCARSEATIYFSARCYQPSLCARALPENQPIYENHLHISRSLADKHEPEILSSSLDTDLVDKRKNQQQELEQREDEAYSKDDELQQEVNDLAVMVTIERIDDIHPSDEDGSPRPAERQRPLPSRDPLPKSGHDETGGHSKGNSNDELNDKKADSEDDNEESRPIKRKRPFSSHDGPMHKKRKHYLQQRSTRQHKSYSKLHQRSLKSHSPQDKSSRVSVVSSTEVRLPSPTPSALHATDTNMSSDYCNLGRSSGDILPTLAEVTFRPHSLHCCSFTAVIRNGRDGRGVSFGQLIQLIESIGHVEKIDDFTIKPIEQHSFLLTGLSRHTSSRLSSGTILSPTVETNLVFDDAPSTILQHSKAVDAKALPSEGSEPSSSDDESGLSDSDPDLSSDDGAYSSKKKAEFEHKDEHPMGTCR